MIRSYCFAHNMVPKAGLEPAQLAPPPPQDGVSTIPPLRQIVIAFLAPREEEVQALEPDESVAVSQPDSLAGIELPPWMTKKHWSQKKLTPVHPSL